MRCFPANTTVNQTLASGKYYTATEEYMLTDNP